MTLLRYLLIFTGIGLLAGAMTILVWDLYQRSLSGGKTRRGNLNPAYAGTLLVGWLCCAHFPGWRA